MSKNISHNLDEANRYGAFVASDNDEQEFLFARMEEAAEAQDELAFVAAFRQVNWDGRPVEDFIKAIQIAFRAGAYMAARRISEEGAKRHPDDAVMQEYARVLAPPKVIANNVPADPVRTANILANHKWLLAHRAEYPGKWLALRNGELLGAEDRLDELVKKIGDTKDVLLTNI